MPRAVHHYGHDDGAEMSAADFFGLAPDKRGEDPMKFFGLDANPQPRRPSRRSPPAALDANVGPPLGNPQSGQQPPYAGGQQYAQPSQQCGASAYRTHGLAAVMAWWE